MQYESGHPIHRRITRSSNPLAQLLTFDRKFSEFGWAKLPPPPAPPPLPPPPLPPCSAAEKLIVDACKRDAQRFIIWKLEGPLTNGFFEEQNPLFARDVLLLRIKNRQHSSLNTRSPFFLSILRTRVLRYLKRSRWWW